MLRRRFAAEIHRRFEIIRRLVWQWVYTDDTLGMRAQYKAKVDRKLTANAPKFQFVTDDKKVKAFNRWLKEQVDQHILFVSPMTGEPLGMNPWLYSYVGSAYKQGALRAYTDVHKIELSKPTGFQEGSKAQFIEQAFGRPERVTKLKLIYTRAYDQLSGVTTQMGQQMSRVLADGLAHGEHPIVVARKLTATVAKIDRTRAKVIALTETMYAHAEGQLDGMEDLGIEDVGADVEFSDSGDDAVCPQCKNLNGKVYTIKQARGIIPVHPRCRCSWKPVVEVPKLATRKRTKR